MQKLKIILKGEVINLCEPTKKFAGGDIWYKWLNNPEINKNLEKEYRKYKNTKKKQIKFFVNHKKNKRRIFIISTKKHVYKGVVSLSKLDKEKKTADIALITDVRIEPLLSPYAGLESIALITNFAFSKLKLKRIDCSFNITQKSWFQRMELLGYKYYFRSKLGAKSYASSVTDTKVGDFRKGHCVYFTSISYEDYKTILKKRGKIWDDLDSMKKRISKLPKKSFWDMNDEFLDNNKKKYYDMITSL